MPEVIYNNRYRLDARIGQGGMAVVYRGYDLLLRRQVAIKVLRPQFSYDEAFVERFRQEAQAAARLSDPNIVNTYDVGEVDGSYYIVQELISGETLAALIAREHRLPESVAIRYAEQICRALAAAHRQGILHRDIKPSNILVTADDVVRVTDFGIARAVNGHTVTSVDTVLGSVPYCSPEQLGSDGLTEASDLYSLGIVIYQMVVGRLPYEANTAVGVAMAHVQAPVPDPTAAGGPVSQALRAVIMKLLQKSPADRFQTAGETLAALRRCAGGNGTLDAGLEEPLSQESPTALLRRGGRAPLAADGLRAQTVRTERAAWNVAHPLSVGVLVLTAAFLAMLVIAVRQASSQGVTMPDVTGKPVAEAMAAVRATGIERITVRQKHDDSAPPGLVFQSTPAAGENLRRRHEATLTVSTGPMAHRLPDVVGRETGEATALLTAQGFNVKLASSVYAEAKRGTIVRMDPPAGAALDKGTTVKLYPSAGRQVTAVPDVVSLSVDEARRRLASAGLKLQLGGTISSANIPAQTIVDQTPGGGTTVSPGSSVLVDVSAGSNSTRVPNVVGGSLEDARRTLESTGLAVGTVTQAVVNDTSPDTVLSQDPAPNSALPQGAAVNVVVATAGTNDLQSPAASSAPAAGSSAPPSLGPIPNVIGMSVEAAKSVLEKAGYRVDHVTALPGAGPDARIVSTEPEAGATTSPGTVGVNLVVGASGR
ncbi:MAG: Stk1 family PASTA domain-containing Ser/Thr kinase [Candidatus Eremiobacteraeota bacterium]|nr:Stk1 family PASTA domain-containing Ser/Thr kinase [Candidatus Eremiobacteraeota bacterium]